MSSERNTASLPNTAWVVVALLWLVALLNYLDRLMITTMRDPIKGDIAMTDAQFGLLTSVFLWIYGALSPLGGYLADRFSRRWVIVGSLFVWSAVTWATAHVHTFEGLLLARALMGVSEACYIPAALALIADYHRGPTRSLATGLHMSGVYAGAALGGIGGFIAEHHGWRSGFNWFGLFGVAYACLLAASLRDANDQTTTPKEATSNAQEEISFSKALPALFQQPAFLVLLAINALVGVANWGINGWLPTYLKEHFQLGLGSAGLSATGYIQVASFFGVLLGGVWADNWSKTQSAARAWVPAIGYCIAAPCLFLTASTDVFVIAIVGMVFFGLGRGFFDANHMPILRSITDERYSATGYGFLNFISCSAGGIMIYVGGLLKDAKVDLSLVFKISAIGLLLVGLMLFAVRSRSQNKLS